MAAEPPPYQVKPPVTDLSDHGAEYHGGNMNYSKSKQAAGEQGTIQSPIEKSGVLSEPPAALGYPLQSDYPQQSPSYQLPPTGPPPSFYDAGSNTVRH